MLRRIHGTPNEPTPMCTGMIPPNRRCRDHENTSGAEVSAGKPESPVNWGRPTRDTPEVLSAAARPTVSGR
jgi:hypothetical protein